MIYACGTVRKGGRKGLPEGIKDTLTRGQSDWRVSKDGIVYIKWKDRKGVHFLSNHADPSNFLNVNRKQKDGSLKEIPCPVIVVYYNRHMGYVVKLDMLKSIYEIGRKSKKCWHRIFWCMVDVAIVNSYIIFKYRAGDSAGISLKSFRIAVVLGLLRAQENCPKRGRPIAKVNNSFKVHVPYEIRYDSCNHMPIHGTSKRCALCGEKSETHRTK